MKAAAVALAMLTGCAALEDLEPDVGPPLAGSCQGDDSDPDVDVSFALDIRPLLDRPRGEAGCSCHTPTNGSPSGIALGGLDLGSVESLRRGGFHSATDIVVPGDPCASVLMDKIRGTPSFGSRMPLDGPPFLGPEEIQLIHDWIAEGAEDD